MSFSQTCVRPRLLFGRFIQAYCKRDDSYHKSTLDLDAYLGNNNGTFTSNRAKSSSLDSLHDIDNQIHLEGSNIVGDLPTKRPGRNHATYDLDICLCNKDGELEWVQHDGIFARDGLIIKAAEGIPGAGLLVALYHYRNGSPDHAKRAATISGKGLFAILFGAIGIQLGPFDPSAIFAVAALSFFGTIIADLVIETYGRAWIQNKRIAAEIPDRNWTSTIVDGLIAGVAIGIATGIAPHAEVAAVRAIQATALFPEELMVAEFELLSVQSLVTNGPRLAKEIAKAGTGGVVRATGFGIQGYATRGPQSGATGPLDNERSGITPGHYYISNFQTGQLLQFIISKKTGRPCVQTAHGNFKKSQLWIIEEGQSGYKIRAYFPGAYMGYSSADNVEGSAPSIVAPEAAIEFKIEGDRREGFVFTPIVDSPNNLALGVDGSDTEPAAVCFAADNGSGQQRWLIEEDDGMDVLKLHEGPVPTNTLVRVSDSSTKTPLRIEVPPKQGLVGLLAVKGKSNLQSDWILEAGFDGYYLRHVETGLYATTSSKDPNSVKNRPLVLSPQGTEFVLSGDDEGGYSIVQASDSKYAIRLDEDHSESHTTAYLAWQLDDTHPKWHIAQVDSD